MVEAHYIQFDNHHVLQLMLRWIHHQDFDGLLVRHLSGVLYSRLVNDINMHAWKCGGQNIMKDVASACAANLHMKSERCKSFGASADEEGVVNCARKVLLYRRHSNWCRRLDTCHRKVTVIRSLPPDKRPQLRSHGCYRCCEAEGFFVEVGARAKGLATDTGVTGRRFGGDAESVTEVGSGND